MSVLIVGAAGFIGTELALHAGKSGFHAIGCDVKPRDQVLDAVFPKEEDYWCLEDGEIPESVWRRTDSLVCLAARRTYAGFGYDDYAGNVRLAHDYMTVAMEHGVRSFVFSSSKAVYSGDRMPWKEEDACVPSSLYGASKLAAEQLGMYYSRQGKLDFKALRFAQVIGMKERKGYLINTLIDNAKEKKLQTVFGTGTQRRQYVYLKDVCRAVEAVLRNPGLSGIFNIGMPGNVSNLELAEAVNKAFGNEGNLTLDPSRPMTGVDDCMDVGKAEEELGFLTHFGIEETFMEIATALKMNRIM